MSATQWIALGLFVFTYALIVTERMHRLKAALVGLSGVLLLKLAEQHDAFGFIDFNTIGLLIGMMILVGIVKQTGLIQYTALVAIRESKGNPWRLLVSLSLLTAIVSAFLDNVTTILLIGPVALAVCETLDLDPLPFLFAEIFASNIGGTATLVGDPPNILIGSAAGLSFNDFLLNVGPAAVLSLGAMYGVLYVLYARELSRTRPIEDLIEGFHTLKRHLNRPLAIRVLAVLGLVLAAFFLHGWLHLEAATIALSGATLGLVVCPVKVEKTLEEIDWVTILFFSTLFMLVGTLEHLDIIGIAARSMVKVVGDHPKILAMLLVWGSGAISAVVDNVPYAAAVIPLVRDTASLAHLDPHPLWWALSLGACLGGNATLVGASANLVMAGLAEKAGRPITFGTFLRKGIPITLATLSVSSVYLYLRYLF